MFFDFGCICTGISLCLFSLAVSSSYMIASASTDSLTVSALLTQMSNWVLLPSLRRYPPHREAFG